MVDPQRLPHGLEVPVDLAELIAKAAARMARDAHQTHRIRHRERTGGTLRPGRETPLWNALRKELRPHLQKHGAQAALARLIGLQRQQINAFVTTGTRMPDAERTLRMLAWLMAQNGQRPPA